MAKINEVLGKDTKLSDKDYWKQFGYRQDAETNDPSGFVNHDIELNFDISFNGVNGTIFQTREKNVNAANLDKWFVSLKKLVRMLDENKADDTWDEFCGF